MDTRIEFRHTFLDMGNNLNKTINMSKPKFYQAVLQEVEGDVLARVYPEHIRKYGKVMTTMTERMGSEEAECPECGQNEWWLYPKESVLVAQGGKAYIECLNCGHTTHL
jgi:DNA-directed RNA polymerase subunit M/transcription elongation factor TFIIS